MTDTEDIISSGDKKPKFFYGYVIVFASFTVMVMAFGVNYSFGIFLKPLIADFGWTKALISGAYSLSTFISGIVGIYAGNLSDRFGPKIVGVICGVFMGLGFLLMSQVNSDWWYLYLIYGLIIPIGLGGCWPGLISVIARWFTSRRGLMTGIVASGISFGTLTVPLLASWIISAYDYRTSYTILGILTLLLIIAASSFLKNNPGQMGQLPLGENSIKHNNIHFESGGVIFKEAIRTSQFAILCAIYICYGYSLHTILVHIVPHAIEAGFPDLQASTVLTSIGAFSIISRISVGWLSDKIGIKPSLVISLGSMVIAYLWLNLVTDLWTFYVFGLFFGFAYGGVISLQALAASEIFGLRSLGIITGAIACAYTFGAAIGPLVAGYTFDVFGSYDLAFWIATGVAVISCIIVIFLRIQTRIPLAQTG
ncbi:MFS transporter [Chloroflexota bacterium]